MSRETRLAAAVLTCSVTAAGVAAQPVPGDAGDPAVSVEYNVPVPLPDGVHLSTDIYRPAGDGRYPAILFRTPYGNMISGRAARVAYEYPRRGYVFLYQDVRGRFDSGGDWYPFRDEARDGHDVIEWIAAQEWSDGRVAMEGGSYMALVQWLAARSGSEHLVALHPVFSPMLGYLDLHQGGAFELTRIAWAVNNHDRTNQTAPYDWPGIVRHLPLTDMDRAAGHPQVPFWQDLVRHPSYDLYWKTLDSSLTADTLEVPVFLVGGWYDPFLRSTLQAFTGSDGVWQADGPERNRRLLVGPWVHGGDRSPVAGELDFGAESTVDLSQMSQRFFDHVLGGVANGWDQEAPVRLFVMGENQWRDEQEWPLRRARQTRWYLQSGGSANSGNGDGVLAQEQATGAVTDTFVYDPADPVPTLGGSLPGSTPGLRGGPFDQSPVEDRADVLVYTSEPLTEDLEVTGPVEVVLWASSSAPDTDFTAKLIDLYPDGRAYNITDGAVRARYRHSLEEPLLLEPGAIERYRIDLIATSNLFRRGHRIRLHISSSNFPRFDRNPNTGHPFGQDDELRKANQTIYHDAARPSHIVLPVVPR